MATHYNLGDLAQTICTLDWLKENYSDHLVVELSSWDFYFDESNMLSALKDSLMPCDLIFFQSGYTMTYVHENERMRRIILETFPNNRTVLLPQTILYETDEQKMWAEETYKDRDNLLLLVRDRISYENAKKLFGKTKMQLFPDIVTTLIGKKTFDSHRAGVLFCVRDDWERHYSKKEMQSLMSRIEQHIHVEQTDTTIEVSDPEDREAVRSFIMQTIEEYSRFKVIVTDRYHGTIFALIAGTPVVVLKTTDHKVVTGAEWFSPHFGNYVSVADTLDNAETMVLQLLNNPIRGEISQYFQKYYYDGLKSLIEEKVLI